MIANQPLCVFIRRKHKDLFIHALHNITQICVIYVFKVRLIIYIEELQLIGHNSYADYYSCTATFATALRADGKADFTGAAF